MSPRSIAPSFSHAPTFVSPGTCWRRRSPGHGVRHSQLYRNLVDATLQYLIEQVGGVEGVYRSDAALPDNFLARRTAGNAVEILGIVAFRASPVWILAALADVCGMGRHLIPEVTEALLKVTALGKVKTTW